MIQSISARGGDAIRKEALEDGIEIDMQQGMQEGEQRGMLNTLFGLVRKGRLSTSDASAEAGLTLAAFNAKMAEYEATSPRP